MEILDYKIRLADRMIDRNPDVTIGEYWHLIKEEKEPVMISSGQPVQIPKRYYPPNRQSRKREPVPVQKHFTRPIAKYDNRGHENIINEYAPE